MEYVKQMTKTATKMVASMSKENMAPAAANAAFAAKKDEDMTLEQKEEAVAALMQQLAKAKDSTIDSTLESLTKICSGNDYVKLAMWKAGGVPTLVELARKGTAVQCASATRLLAFLSHFADGRYAIKDAGGLAPLIASARDTRDDETHKEARYSAEHALKFLALAHPVKLAMQELGYTVEL